MPLDAEPTRQKLLDAAMRLFAERGVDAVTLGEINRAAGQRNNSALHYHFGGRDALLRTLLRPFSDSVREYRFRLISAPPAALFVENLVDMIAGALAAPAGQEAVKGCRAPLGRVRAAR